MPIPGGFYSQAPAVLPKALSQQQRPEVSQVCSSSHAIVCVVLGLLYCRHVGYQLRPSDPSPSGRAPATPVPFWLN